MNSRRSSNAVVAACLAVAFALPFSTGCASYSRIVVSGESNAIPNDSGGPRLCVVDCVLETRRTLAVAPGEKGGTSVTHVPGIQPALQAARPEWFASDESAIPIVVKLRSVVTAMWGFKSMGGCVLGPASSVVAMCTLGTVPTGGWPGPVFEMNVSIQLDPGGWSDSAIVEACQENFTINKISDPLFGFMHSPEKGWQRVHADNGSVHDEDMQANEQSPFATPHGQFTLLTYLKHGDGPGGTNPVFAKFLANEIVKTWTSLSSADKRSVRRNPVALKKFQEVHPETGRAASSSNTSVAVPAQVAGNAAVAASTPSVAGYGYVEASGRGFVEFARNGTEHLAALKWAREQIIPKLTGKGAQIRIDSEKTLENGNSRIDFEVVK